MPSLLLRLPDSLVRELFCKWLYVIDLAPLESAFCCKPERAQFLSIVPSSQSALWTCNFFIERTEQQLRWFEEKIWCDENMYQWCVLRGIPIVEARVTSVKPVVGPGLGANLISLCGRHLRHLMIQHTLYYCFATASHLLLLVNDHCPNLSHLSFQVESDYRDDSSACALAGLTRVLPNLVYLSIEWFHVGPDLLAAVLQQCTSLTSLRIGSCTGLKRLPLEVALPTLRSLNLVANYRIVDDQIALAIAARCPSLTTLIIFGNTKITDVGVKAIAAGCRQLQQTDIHSSRNATSAAISNLVLSTSLTELNMQRWPEASNDLLLSINKCLTTLMHLSLWYCKWVDDDTLSLCAQHCTSLTSLDISGCRRLCGQGIRAICVACNQLRMLRMNNCSGIDDTTMTHISTHCPHLQELCVNNTHVTDEAVTAVVLGCSRLTTLDLDCCIRITDATLVAITTHCRFLQCLSITQCSGITENGTVHLLVHLQAPLRYLALSYTRKCAEVEAASRNRRWRKLCIEYQDW